MKYENILENEKYYPCEYAETDLEHFENSESYLKWRAPEALKQREERGLEGLVGDLHAIIINIEPKNKEGTILELIKYTGYCVAEAFVDKDIDTTVFKENHSADIMLTCRQNEADNPYLLLVFPVLLLYHDPPVSHHSHLRKW